MPLNISIIGIKVNKNIDIPWNIDEFLLDVDTTYNKNNS